MYETWETGGRKFVFDQKTQSLSFGQSKSVLTTTEIALLRSLIGAGRNGSSRESLHKALINGSCVAPSQFDRHLFGLRAKLVTFGLEICFVSRGRFILKSLS